MNEPNSHTEEVLLDHINAAIPDDGADPVLARLAALEQKIAELTAQNAALQQEIKAAASTNNAAELRSAIPAGAAGTTSSISATESLRKTLPPSMCALLAKTAESTTLDAAGHFDATVLDQALASLSVEQRIAVKAEMARAGLIA